MNMKQYIGKKCKLILKGPLYYTGIVIETDEYHTEILDVKCGKTIILNEVIVSIQEVSQ